MWFSASFSLIFRHPEIYLFIQPILLTLYFILLTLISATLWFTFKVRNKAIRLDVWYLFFTVRFLFRQWFWGLLWLWWLFLRPESHGMYFLKLITIIVFLKMIEERFLYSIFFQSIISMKFVSILGRWDPMNLAIFFFLGAVIWLIKAKNKAIFYFKVGHCNRSISTFRILLV